LGIESGVAGWNEGFDSIAGESEPGRGAGKGGTSCRAGAAGTLAGTGDTWETPGELRSRGGEELNSARVVDAEGAGKGIDSGLASGEPRFRYAGSTELPASEFEVTLDSELVRRIDSAGRFDISVPSLLQKNAEKTKAPCKPRDNRVAIASLFDIIIDIAKQRQS